MTGGTINDNEVFRGSGGGVAVHGAMTMTGGTIKNNKADIAGSPFENGGGGIFLWHGVLGKPTLNMTGGTIQGNTIGANSKGQGVLVNSGGNVTMEMSGSAKIDTNNDVYLDHEGSDLAFITVTDALTSTPAAARLTMKYVHAVSGSGYYVNRNVVKAGGSYPLTSADVSKFQVTQEGPTVLNPSPQNWKVVKDGNVGKLKKDS